MLLIYFMTGKFWFNLFRDRWGSLRRLMLGLLEGSGDYVPLDRLPYSSAR
ncbi:MAG: hypothetical protein IIA59_13015 [Candidatus Marinimicrobia bacterium]|nr:hypothetical protein [Candidatus Neomarinimicrobiota bacterium]